MNYLWLKIFLYCTVTCCTTCKSRMYLVVANLLYVPLNLNLYYRYLDMINLYLFYRYLGIIKPLPVLQVPGKI